MDVSPVDASQQQRRFDFVPAKRRRVLGLAPETDGATSAGTPPGAAAANLRQDHHQVVDRLAKERTLLLLRHGATLGVAAAHDADAACDAASNSADAAMAEAAGAGYGSMSARGVPAAVSAGGAIVAGGYGSAGGMLGDTCHICRTAGNQYGTAALAPCAHCAKASCAACHNSCEGCGATFCKFCSTCDYSSRLERWFCLDCAAYHRAG